MTEKSIRDQVVDKVSERAGQSAEHLDDETVLVDIDFDSLDLVEIVMELEDELGLDADAIDEDEIEAADTLGDLVAMIERAAQ